jgi:hypothetical protein
MGPILQFIRPFDSFDSAPSNYLVGPSIERWLRFMIAGNRILFARL